jgi:hypothetical integral membrane protein (TIGR02206 family)
MKLFGAVHLSLLCAIGLVAFFLVKLSKAGILNAGFVCLAIGATLSINEAAFGIWRYSREGIHTGNLPLELCDAAVWAAILACFTRSTILAEFTWFAGLGGAGMALLTPALYSPWPSWPAIYFFVAHGGVAIAAFMLAFSHVMRFEPHSPWRAFGLLLCWTAIAGAADAAFKADYMFLREKPPAASLLDFLGPWPVYIAGGFAVALVLFWLLWLPVRPGKNRNRTCS